MLAALNQTLQGLNLSPATLVLVGIGAGLGLTVYGVAGIFAGPDAATRRLARRARQPRENGPALSVLRARTEAPQGLFKAFIPSDQKDLTRIERQLAQAGLNGRHAVRNYYLTRVFLGLVLPCLLIAVIYALRAKVMPLPPAVLASVNGLREIDMLKLLGALVGAGFFLPSMWLNSRVSARQRLIEEAFPNALDLVQISVEAGMGFDAALRRVAQEIAKVAPDLSYEFMAVYNEVRSGRTREAAMQDMAARTGVDEVRSFANVVLQSVQFGTSISSALTAYAREMRIARETKAQEMANKLPVKMSAVMATLMLPALIMLTIGPSVFRFIRFFH